jgi:hypothetical protein
MFFSRIGSTAANHITMISGSDVVTNWRVVRKDGAERPEYDAVESREAGTYRVRGG